MKLILKKVIFCLSAVKPTCRKENVKVGSFIQLYRASKEGKLIRSRWALLVIYSIQLPFYKLLQRPVVGSKNSAKLYNFLFPIIRQPLFLLMLR